jgi:hypothetical protein
MVGQVTMTDDPKNIDQERDAAEHVAEAHRILSGLRQQLDKHPDLENAITNLEMALSLLTTNTGGML